MDISILMTSAISISASLFFTLGQVAFFPCVILMSIGLMSLILAGNALCQQENNHTPPGI